MFKKITFEVETITPMFLAGADQGKAELRAASIKGLLRFWWRALQAESDLGELRRKESQIFGSSDEGAGGSSFAIRVTQPNKNPLPEYQNPGRNDPVGYHLYSVFMQRDRKRPYFPEGSRFTITLSSKDEDVLRIASASLWLLVYLGALGTRSRRGAGNMVITSFGDTNGILSNTEIEFIPNGANSEEVAGWLKRNFEATKKIVSDGKTKFISEYSNLSFSRFVIGNQSFTTWKEALGSTSFKVFRDNNKSRIFETAAFGLPILHSTTRTTVKGRAANISIDRRSSPILFKVIKVNNAFYCLVIRMAGEFLPQGGVITANHNTQKPDYSIIDEFWAELKNKNKGTEHILSMPDTLVAITNTIKQEVDPQKIILFGSKARGDFHSQSDTDIAITTEKQIANQSFTGAIDIVDLNRADKTLTEKIMKEGVTIYEREA